jgi:glycogen debranching enzyme
MRPISAGDAETRLETAAAVALPQSMPGPRMVTILEGSTFCVSDELGDLGSGTGGLFAEDSRFLSGFELAVGGCRPLLLSSGRTEYFSAAFFLRNDVTSELPQDVVSIDRRRAIGPYGMVDTILVRNEGMERLRFELALAVGADFADIFTVKELDFALGTPGSVVPEPSPLCRYDEEAHQVLLRDTEGDACTQVLFSQPCDGFDEGRISFELDLRPRQTWQVRFDVMVSPDGRVVPAPIVEVRHGTELERIRESLEAWHLQVPRVRSGWRNIEETFARSVADLASLRLRGEGAAGSLPAAGMPWFMTVFGRDTLLTCLQTLLFGPELARNALLALTALQAREDDPEIDAEPGKIVHELRRGKAAATWFPAYYGTVDATPLFLVLLSETWRWTADDGFVRALRDPALRALGWIDRWGDRDGDGFVEYERRSPRGLANQSWKDSWDSQRFSDGRLADPPIAPAEVQGYVYDAKLRLAELARDVWEEPALATKLETEARALQQRFDEAYWVDERGGYYALALDGAKRPVDALCSNIGHLLWSGIVPDPRAAALVDRLLSSDLWSGWGVRTMASTDFAYNPLAYHRGTVWPHDTSIVAAGLARYGFREEASTLVRALFGAARWFDWSLPEVFAGFSRRETPFPIAYPTAARPQAWAAGAPVLCLQVLLGLRADPHERRVLTDVHDAFPAWAGRVEMSGVRAFDRTWSVHAADGVEVEVT